MTYATQQNMIDRFGTQELIELTDRSNLGVINTAALAVALNDADDEIDGYLAGVCVLPIVNVPDRLVKLAADIARYELYGANVTEQVRARYTDAISYLKQVVIGTASLGLDATNNTAPEVGGVGMSATRPVFSACTLSDY